MATKRELEKLLRQERARSDRLEKKVDELLDQQKKLQDEIRELIRKLEEARRAAKRQAAPFARRKRKEHRKKPGRKPGHEGASQAIPDHVDEERFAPLNACPCCGGKVDDVIDHEQFVVDLPQVKAHVTRVVTQSGHCDRCDRPQPASRPGVDSGRSRSRCSRPERARPRR